MTEIFQTFFHIIERPGFDIDSNALEILDTRLMNEGIPHTFVILKTDEEINAMEANDETYICSVGYRDDDEMKIEAILLLWAADDLGYNKKQFRRMMQKYLNS